MTLTLFEAASTLLFPFRKRKVGNFGQRKKNLLEQFYPKILGLTEGIPCSYFLRICNHYHLIAMNSLKVED